MHLGMSKSKNSTSLYVLKSTYENGFHSTKIIEKLGTIEELELKLNGQDPIIWAKKHIAELNKLDKQDKHEVTAKYSPVKIIQKNEQRSFNGGYLFLQQFYSELGFHDICSDIKRRNKLDFNLDAILSRLIYSRIIYPATQLSYYDSANLFIEPPDFTPKQVAKGLRILAAEKDYIARKLYENSQKAYGVNKDHLFYDATICLYETNNRKDADVPNVPMEIYFDGNLMPLTYRYNLEHLESQPLNDLEKKIKEAFRDSRAVSTTEGGISSGASKDFKDWNIPNSYIMTLSFEQLHDGEKKAALDRDGWIRSDSGEIYNLDQLRLDDEIKNPSRYYYKELAIGASRTIITYSEAKFESTHLQHEFYLAHHQMQPSLDISTIDTKAGSQGIQAIVTNMRIPAKKIIQIANYRQSVHDYFRLLSMEVPEKGSTLNQKEQIDAHFITCYSALTVYSALLRKMNVNDSIFECIETLQQMNFMKIHSEGYVPLYTRTDLTDLLHETAGFRTDYEIVNSNLMNKLIKAGRK